MSLRSGFAPKWPKIEALCEIFSSNHATKSNPLPKLPSMRSELAPKSPKIEALRKISPQMTQQNQVGLLQNRQKSKLYAKLLLKLLQQIKPT